MLSLAIEDVGEGQPVVLLHGLTATNRYVVHGSRSLERSGHRVVDYDARGRAVMLSLEWHVADAFELIVNRRAI